MIIMGVDLGFKTSPTAISILRTVENSNVVKIVALFKFGPFLAYNSSTKVDNIFGRTMVLESITNLAQLYEPYSIVIEKPMFRGKNNENFLRFFGSFELTMLKLRYYQFKRYFYLAPTSVKKKLGHGKLEKDAMAEACKAYLDKCSKIKLTKAIKSEDWDVTDSVAIGIAGLMDMGKIT